MDELGDIEAYYQGMGDWKVDQRRSKPASPYYGMSQGFRKGDEFRYPLICSFAFPCVQTSLSHAVLVEWTGPICAGRNFPQDPIEGTELCDGMRMAVRRADLPLLLVGNVSETVGAMSDGAHLSGLRPADRHPIDRDQRPIWMSVIVDRGVNGSYYEGEHRYGYVGSVIDLECGHMDRELPLTIVDFELDFLNPKYQGQNIFEKITSFSYLGEITRTLIIHIFQHRVPTAAWRPGTLSFVDVFRIVEDNSDDLHSTKAIIERAWGKVPDQDEASEYSSESDFDSSEVSMIDSKLIIQKCCKAVVDRAAILIAGLIVGCLAHADFTSKSEATKTAINLLSSAACGTYIPVRRQVGVAICGKFYRHSLTFRKKLEEWIQIGTQSFLREHNLEIGLIEVSPERGLALLALHLKASAMKTFGM